MDTKQRAKRVLVWFSCGTSSAIAAKLTIKKYGNRAEVLYCDTFAYEHPDNLRFFTDVEFPLIEQNISKRECLLKIHDAGIELPEMYKLGYRNNNCIGCVKGQSGYWNKIRVDFPEIFSKMAKMERTLDVAINKSYAGDGKRKRVFLDELDSKAGRYPLEPDISCGVQCSLF